ncbi:rRNA adenine N-6-methyltransferase family protein [Nostoc sp.]
MNIQTNLFTSSAGDEDLLENVAPPKKPVTQSDLQLSVRFQEMAEALQVSIDEKTNPAILSGSITARKLRVGRAIERDGEYLGQIQRCLLAIAAALSDGTLPLTLTRVKTRALVEQIYCNYAIPESRLTAAGLGNETKFQEARIALLELLEKYPIVADPEKERQRELRRLQRFAAVANIPGYFPTPSEVVQLIIKALDLTPGMTVLEPSAGSGHIAQALFDLGLSVDCVELDDSLAKLLSLKGFKVYNQDFLTFQGTYSRIAMNPDFRSNGDISHIRHAYDNCLDDGGLLVSVCSSGAFFRSTKTETMFRDWVDRIGGVVKSLPKDAFRKGDRPVGVSTELLTLRK